MNTLMKRTNGNAPISTFSGLVDRLFPNDVNRMFDDSFWGFNGVSQKVSTPVNIRETNKSYELQVVAPGFKKENIKVSVGDNMLTVTLEQKEEHNDANKEEGWLRKDYQQRSFTRSFTLDESIEAAKIDATYLDGILKITLPKKEAAQSVSRTIEIK